LRRTRDGRADAARGAGRRERCRERIDRGARRHDVVDDRDALPTQIALHAKRSGDAREASACALSRLARALEGACDAALEQRQGQLARDRARDLERLVVTALAQARRVQRHGHERIDLGTQRRERAGEQQPERAAERAGPAILQRVHVVIERCRIGVRRDERVHAPGRPAPRAARDGQSEAAGATGVAHAREVARAHGAEPARRWACARRARLDEQCAPHP
jgi:hypothetical protein